MDINCARDCHPGPEVSVLCARWLFTALGCALAATAAHADVKVVNMDSKTHEITARCRSTIQRSILAGTKTTLGAGPCTVTLKSTGASLTGRGNDTLVIPKAK